MTYLLIIKDHWFALLLAGIITAGLAVGLSFIPQQLYRSEIDLLIVQKQSATVDAYLAQKSAEKIGKSLVNVIQSLDFLNRVIATEKIDNGYFSSETSTTRKTEWEDLVNGEVVAETGIIKLYGYGTTGPRAEAVVLGVAQVMMNNSVDYMGTTTDVNIKQIDGPLTSERPVKPNIPLNGLAAGVLGMAVVYSYFLLQVESQRIAAEKKSLQYQALPNQSGRDTIVPLGAPQYTVLNEFPAEPYTYGAKLEEQSTPVTKVDNDDSAVSMHDHLG